MKRITLITLGSLTAMFLGFGILNQNVVAFLFGLVFLGGDLWAIYNVTQKRHSILRNYPILGTLRWVFEAQRDKIRQYFNESDIDEFPISRRKRSRVYQRSKNEIETTAFGTIQDVNKEGYEYLAHSMFPVDESQVKGIRVKFGGKDCTKPVSTSILNISAMSFGALSGAAIRALNKGAKEGGFLHNTGEGGISKHHLQGGGLIFQIGTGYFGAGTTDESGKRVFHAPTFKVNAAMNAVKMIEVKLSQGAKPGHGGILPGKKNTPEIAAVRGVSPVETVHSPSYHTAFSDYTGLANFIKELRELSGGKPVGIKMCMGSKREFTGMIRAFKQLNVYPDYIALDGAEGGTGSAPLEYADHVGMPMTQALIYADSILKQANLREEIKIIASGKIIDTFDIVRALALGADAVYMARAFMFSLGCIQARECNKDTCPVGVATQNKNLEKGLVVEDKFKRVYNFHHNTIIRLKELVGTMGLKNVADITSDHILKNTGNDAKTLTEFYEINKYL